MPFPRFGGSGIDQLTGDVAAGPGTGSQAATLAAIGSASGPIGSTSAVPVVTIDTKGRVTGLTSTAIVTGVSSVTADDASIVVNTAAGTVNIETGTLDAIATAQPPAAAVPFAAQKITGLANGSASSDAAAFGQVPVPGNGYGITGNTGHTPTPAVGFTVAAAVIGAPVALANGVATLLLNTASLGIGTWLVTMGSAIQSTSPGAASDAAVILAAAGTATASLSGPLQGVYGPGVITTSWQNTLTVTFIAVVTVAGTLKLTGTFYGAAGGAAETGPYTGYSAVRIA